MIEPARETDSLYRFDGEKLHPSELSQGPWNPEHQHGGAVCGALAWASLREPAPVPMRAVRLCFDLMRPVPLRPLGLRVQAVRSGRRVQLVDVALLDGDEPVARASVLRVRTEAGVVPGAEERGAPEDPLPVTPEEVAPMEKPRRFSGPIYMPGFIRAVALRRQQPEPRNGEPAIGWTRLRCQLVEGEPVDPLVRLATQADFVSGMANGLDFTRYVSINPEVVLFVERLPTSDWIGIRPVTRIGEDGIGVSHGTLYDPSGVVGRASASLYVARR